MVVHPEAPLEMLFNVVITVLGNNSGVIAAVFFCRPCCRGNTGDDRWAYLYLSDCCGFVLALCFLWFRAWFLD